MVKNKNSKQPPRQRSRSSSEERQQNPAPSADDLASPRSPPPATFNANSHQDDDIPIYASDVDSDNGPVYQPESPAYSREGSASPPKSQEKSSAGPASRGGSPGAGIDANASREEVSAFNKQANILTRARH